MPLVPDIAEILNRAIIAQLADVFTGMAGIVVDFDPVACTAAIQLAVKRTVESEDGLSDFSEVLPNLPNVPILYAQAAAGVVRFPLTAGDPVLVLALTLDHTKWRLNGEVPADPADAGRMHLKSAIAIPGFVPDLNVTPLVVSDGIEITAPVGSIVVSSPTGNITIQAPQTGDPGKKIVLAAPRVFVESNAVVLGVTAETDTTHPVALANLVANELSAIQTTLASLTGGGAHFGTPYAPGSVGASHVNAK